MDRRKFLAATLTAGTAASLTSAATAAQEGKTIRIIGVSCSPRKGKTTATAIHVALDAAKAVDSRIKTELVDLGGSRSPVRWAARPRPRPGSRKTTSIWRCCPC